MSTHVHLCPDCGMRVACYRDCTIEPDLGTTLDDIPHGATTRCDTCARSPRPDHYKVLCISFYTEDLARLDETVRELKRRGHRRVSRSSLLRVALAQLDLDKVPRRCG